MLVSANKQQLISLFLRGVKTLCSKPVQLCDVCSLQPPLLHNIVRGSYPRSLSPPDRHLLVALVSRPGRSKQLQTVREWAGPAVPGCLALGSKLKHWRLETMAVIPDTATQPLWLGQSPSCLSITISVWLDTHSESSLEEELQQVQVFVKSCPIFSINLAIQTSSSEAA